MQVSVEAKQGLMRHISVQISAEELAAKYQEKLKDFAKKAPKVAGFRPGKVSPRIIEQKYGQQVRAELINDEMNHALSHAFKDHQLRPVSSPKVNVIKDGFDNQALEFEADVEVFPEVKLAHFDEIDVEHQQAEIDEKMINETVEKIRSQTPSWTEVSRGAQNDDLINIDYELQTEELTGDKKHGHHFSFVLGAGQMIKGFDEQLIGAQPGEERVLDVVFPEEYHEPILAGKPLKITVKVHTVSESKPATDEDLCKLYKVEDNNFDQFKEKIKHSLDEQAKAAARVKMKEQLLDKLLALHPLELPESLVQQEKELLKTHQLELLQPKVKALEETGLSQEEAVDKACFEESKRKVALSMLLGEYIRENDIKPDNQRVFETVQEITRGHQQPMEMTKWFFEKEERIQSIVSFVLEEQAVDSLLEKVKHHHVTVNFNDLMAVSA